MPLLAYSFFPLISSIFQTADAEDGVKFYEWVCSLQLLIDDVTGVAVREGLPSDADYDPNTLPFTIHTSDFFLFVPRIEYNL